MRDGTPAILAIRLRRLGDVLLATPSFRALREAHPLARLDVLVLEGFDAPLRGLPWIDEVLVLQPGLRPWLALARGIRRRPYDIVVDLQGSPRSLGWVLASWAPIRAGWRKGRVRDLVYTHRAPYEPPEYDAQRMLRVPRALGIARPPHVRLAMAVTPDDHAYAADRLAAGCAAAARPIVALSTVARVPAKQWPAAHFAEIADRLIERLGAHVVLSYGPGELPQAMAVVREAVHGHAFQFYGDTTLQRLCALYERCDLWIGNDGAPKHVATAAGCPVVVMTGSEGPLPPLEGPDAEGQVGLMPLAGPSGVEGVRIADVWAAALRLLDKFLLSGPSGVVGVRIDDLRAGG